MTRALRVSFSNLPIEDIPIQHACCSAIVALERKKNPDHTATYSQGSTLDLPKFHASNSEALMIVSQFFNKTQTVSFCEGKIASQSMPETIEVGAHFGIHANTDNMRGFTITVEPRTPRFRTNDL